jgi:hypothetical protein
MDSQSILQNRFTSIFGIFMIILYATLGVLFLFVIDWVELPKTNRTVIGIALLLYAAFRTFMLFRMRARMRKQE